jgi:hypothetical protein
LHELLIERLANEFCVPVVLRVPFLSPSHRIVRMYARHWVHGGAEGVAGYGLGGGDEVGVDHVAEFARELEYVGAEV